METLTETLHKLCGPAFLDTRGTTYLYYRLSKLISEIVVPKAIEEYDTKSDFPAQGDSQMIYIAKDTTFMYYWDGSEYKLLSSKIDYDDIQNAVTNYLDNASNIETLINTAISEKLTESIENYFNTDAGKTLLTEIVNGLLDDIIGDYLKEIQQAITDNERVTANALKKHEVAITELQSQVSGAS